MMLKRGPQLRAVGERIAIASIRRDRRCSARQSAQVAMSGRTKRRRRRPSPSLSRISKPCAAGRRRATTLRGSGSTARGGRSADEPQQECARGRRARPRPRSKTPCGALRTQPSSPSSRRQAVDERPEADALHGAANDDAQAFTHGPPAACAGQPVAPRGQARAGRRGGLEDHAGRD